MFGQPVFAELIFADMGVPVRLEDGWIKVCPEKDGWTNVPGQSSGWQVVDRSQENWNKQSINDVGTVECGDFRPTNIPRK